MSSTAVISPVAPTTGVAGTAIVPLALLVGTALWAAARAIAAADPKCAEFLNKSREDLRRERLAIVDLRTCDFDRVVRAAREASFRTESLQGGATRVSGPGETPVWMTRTPSGVRMVGSEASMQRLLIANTASRAAEHLLGRGFRVQLTRTGSGEVTLLGKGGGTQALKVRVSGAGEASVDMEKFQGKECEEVVHGLATAIEGSITSFCRKPEYFAAPPVKIGGKTRV